MNAREVRAAIKIAKAVKASVEINGNRFRFIRISKKEAAAMLDGLDREAPVRARFEDSTNTVLIIGRSNW